MIWNRLKWRVARWRARSATRAARATCEHKRCRVIQERNVTHCYDCGAEWKPSFGEIMQEDILRRDKGSYPP